MRHVFVETNWIVDWGGPEHLRHPAALELAASAARGDIALHLPSCCIAEAITPIRKLHPKSAADAVRAFLPWAQANSLVATDDAQAVRTVLDKLEGRVHADLNGLRDHLASLRKLPGIDVFSMDDEMLECAATLCAYELDLKPFDQAILAAILIRADQLQREGEVDLSFCEKDGDLQPWTRDGNRKKALTELYDERRIWVYGDFTMTTPAPYEGWPPE